MSCFRRGSALMALPLLGSGALLAPLTAQAGAGVEGSVVVRSAAAPGIGAVTQDDQARSARIHALLQKYGMGCGDPSCPFCNARPVETP
ncbi:hypothetical protein [uncultured Aquitalea sp.]|uniref:hypothetical protein n=1 Tax=uncultured Aquitalea sp. TaxID=540272 RepID=UPI002600BAC4|nr:hypothetical protein [uncultured Aquitalea sp.]